MPSPSPLDLPANTFHHGVSLRALNTFGLEATAQRYYRAETVGALREALRAEQPRLVLGGGSNLLLTRDVPGLTLHVGLRGVTVYFPDDDRAEVRAAAGEHWHALVEFTLAQDLGGLENLSLIPGSVGATPIQNIGAYGVEIREHLVSVEALDRASLRLRRFTPDELEFGYRESAFKRALAGRYIVTAVTYALTRRRHAARADYGDIRAHLQHRGREPEPRWISEAVVDIRRSKLPDPVEIGNSGSFFKNPELDADSFARFAERHPEAPHYPLAGGRVKVPAGWLIERAGWKGHRRGAIGVHDRQALVLVNHGDGRGEALWALAQEIRADVLTKFGIALEPEVNVM